MNELEIKGYYHQKIIFGAIEFNSQMDIEIKHEISDEYMSVNINKEEAKQIIDHLKMQFDI